MVINNMKRTHKRLDLKEIAMNKLESLVQGKCNVVKADNVWFETPVNDIICANHKYGYFTFTQKSGTYVYSNAIKGKDLVNMIEQINSNRFFSYVESNNGKFIKIRPKRKNVK